MACPYRRHPVTPQVFGGLARDPAEGLGRAFVLLAEGLRPVLEHLAAIATQNAHLRDQLASGPDPWVVDDSE